MASLLRHSVGSSPTVTSPTATSPFGSASARRLAACTVVSHEGPHGDCSFMLIRERSAPAPSGEHLTLRGDFGALTRFRLAALLASLPADRPLHIDLRRVTTLDEGCLSLLLKARRDHPLRGAVVFQVAEVGPVRQMVYRLGLEENSIPKTADAPPVLLPGQRSKTAPANGVVLPA